MAASAMAASTKVVLCQACGEEASASDRRSVSGGGGAQNVLAVWTELFSVEIHRQRLDMPSTTSGCMCRKCFYAYEKYIKLKEILSANAKKAVNALFGQSSDTSPRKRLSSSSLVPPSKRVLQAPIATTSTKSPDVSVHISHKDRRKYILTPSRKKIVKAVARKSMQSMARECFKEPRSRAYLTNSVLRADPTIELKVFKWDTLLAELSQNAPVFLSLLHAATHTRRNRENKSAVIGLCAAVLIKHRFQKMNVVQKLISLILYAGHSGKKVFTRLQRLNLCVSHQATITFLTKIGESHDNEVVEWRNSLAIKLEEEENPQVAEIDFVTMSYDGECSSSSDSDATSVVSYESDISPPVFSPFTSDEDVSELEESCLENSSGADPQSQEEFLDTHETLPLPCELGFKLVGDNIDKTVRPRYIRIENYSNKSLHYFHSFAVQNRVDFNCLPDVAPVSCLNHPNEVAKCLLPSTNHDIIMKDHFIVIISRILYSNMEFFKASFDGCIEWHIRHKFYQEMCTKSHVIPLGITLKNENKLGEMVEIMTHLQKYVPAKEYVKQVSVPDGSSQHMLRDAILHPLLFGGDQLTAAQARGAKKIKMNGISPLDRLEGLVPCAEDWHAKVNLLEVIWKYFYSTNSSTDHGTLYQLRNLTNRTNVVNKPGADFNACEDFFVLIIECLVLTAAMSILGMESLSDMPKDSVLPNAENVWMLTDEERKPILVSICEKIITSFVSFEFQKVPVQTSDNVFNYATSLLSIGCFYLSFCDAIKEGDGERVLLCWRYLLPIFKGTGRKNYSLEVLNMLCQHDLRLSQRLAQELIWNRFVNVHGLPGRNIPADLHMEHLNKLCKEAITGLGVNKTENAIVRIGKSLGMLSPVLDQYDLENGIPECSIIRSTPGAERDRKVVVNELKKRNIFSLTGSRTYPTFNNPKNVLHLCDHFKMIQWMRDHI